MDHPSPQSHSGSKRSLASFFAPDINASPSPPPVEDDRGEPLETTADSVPLAEDVDLHGDDTELPVRTPTFAHFSSHDEDEFDPDEDEDDDGLIADDSTPFQPGEDDEGSLGDEEEVDVAADAYSWKIDHSNGHHRLRGERLYRELCI